MKTFHYSLFILFGFIFTTSCSRDGVTETEDKTENTTITPDATNDFVWKAMNSWYYWQSNVGNLADNIKNNNKTYTDLINGKTPDELFYKLLYDYGKTDRFSWIENNNSIVSSRFSSKVENISGLDFAVFSKDKNGTRYIAFVNYVVPKSSADQAGIKRGDVITKVNGAYITENNYDELFNDNFTITRAETASTSIVDGYYIISTTDKAENISISKTAIEENPIAFYKAYQYDGKTIGYLVYNSFNISYNAQLNEAFAKMKNDGVSELILDLRYNPGGYLNNALALAQMITGSFTGQNYIYEKYNSKHTQYSGYSTLSNTLNLYKMQDGYPEKTGETQTINSLNLPKIHILLSHMSASASELTTIGLQAFINVETIGYPTSGKFVGSHTLYDSPNDDFINFEKRNKSHNWSLQPITFEYFDKNQSPHPQNSRLGRAAITPEHTIHPYEWIGKVKDFGETSDPDLAKALNLITGRAFSKFNYNKTETVQNFKEIPTRKINPAKGLIITDFKNHIEKR